MGKAYLSFLGVTNYVPCTYCLNDRKTLGIRFVQEATVQLACPDWTRQDRLLIFTTPEAYDKNWLNNGHQNDKAGETLEGLKGRLEKLGLNPVLENIPIPEGKNETEIWEIFQIVYDRLHPGDQVVFDITHALRSIPMLALVALNYAKVLKDISLEKIYYGAFEVLGPINQVKNMDPAKRLVPIFDLTPFDHLLDWTIAIDRFSGAGDASAACALAKEKIHPLLRESRGADRTTASIRDVINALEPFTQALTTCRGPEISPTVKRLKEALSGCGGIHLVKPLGPLMDKIKSQIEDFPGNDTGNGIQAVKWCIHHNLIQQGFTLLQETLITYLLNQLKWDPFKRDDRELIGQGIKIWHERMPEEKWSSAAKKHPERIEKIKALMVNRAGMGKIFGEVSKSRNDLNHAGFLKNRMSPQKFKEKLEELTGQIEHEIL